MVRMMRMVRLRRMVRMARMARMMRMVRGVVSEKADAGAGRWRGLMHGLARDATSSSWQGVPEGTQLLDF